MCYCQYSIVHVTVVSISTDSESHRAKHDPDKQIRDSVFCICEQLSYTRVRFLHTYVIEAYNGVDTMQ